MGFNIIVDTREKYPYEFKRDKWCADIITQKLDTGDYSAEGLEHLLCIERKRTVSEIAQNLTTERFERELERMAEYPYRYILCEFSWEDVWAFPYNGELPRTIARKIRVKGHFLVSKLLELHTIHDVHVIYCGDARQGQRVCSSIIKNVWDIENGK